MQDPSHRLLFLAATTVMCAGIMYGSEAVPELLMPPENVLAAGAVKTDSGGGQFQKVNFVTDEAPGREGDQDADRTAGATVVPNSASCPTRRGESLVSPPMIGHFVGSPTAVERAEAAGVMPGEAVLGTGESCPALSRDVGVKPYNDLFAQKPAASRPSRLAGR